MGFLIRYFDLQPYCQLSVCFMMWFMSTSCVHEEHTALKIGWGRVNSVLSVTEHESPVCYFEAIMKRNNLMNVIHEIPAIHVDMKYASTDNFMHKNMYGCLKKAYLLPVVVQMLKTSQEYLHELHPDFSLVIYDAARPIQIQHMMWDSLRLPFEEKIKFLSNPVNGSLHNFGAAVDVSVLDANGNPLDMGTEFDYIGELAHPVREYQMLEQGKLTSEHISNRQLLRKVMRKGGFWGIQTEWWHFNAMTREFAIANYKLIK